MFYCDECSKEFPVLKIIYDHHGEPAAKPERLRVCPFCNSMNFTKVPDLFCHCCGAKIKSGEYCCKSCETKGKKLRAEEEKRKHERHISTLFLALGEVESYNKENNTNLSYGEYFSRIKNEQRR